MEEKLFGVPNACVLEKIEGKKEKVEERKKERSIAKMFMFSSLNIE